MAKYSKKLIFNYVMGNDLIGFNIDDLENDWEFMREVFDYTNDKKIFDLCSDELKENVELIKFLIYKFKEDKKFVFEISSNILNKTSKNLDKLEIQILLENLFSDDECFKNKFFNKLEMQVFYTLERLYYELELKEDGELKDFLQLGFYYFFEQYKERQLITDFVAKKMINEIFDFRNNNLEEIIHSMYNGKKQVDKISSTKFIIDYISNHDLALGNYLCVHIGLIDELKKSVDRIFRNFDYYKDNKYKDVIEGIVNYIEDYSIENNYLDDKDLRKYIGKDLKNKDIWGCTADNLIFTVQREDEYGFYEDEISLNDIPCDEYGFYEIDNIEFEKIRNDILYVRLREDVKRMLKNNEVYDRYINLYKKNDSKCKVLKLK